MKQGFVGSWLIVLFMGLTGTAQADVMFSDFGPNGSYLTVDGYSVAGPDSTAGQFEQAFQFSPTISGTVTQIDVAMCHLTGVSGATVRLYGNSSNMLGGLIRSWSINVEGQFGNNNPAIQILDGSGISLTQGTSYWLYAGASGNAQHIWNTNDQSVMGLGIANHDGIGWQLATEAMGAFDIQGRPVPEPGTWLACSAGVVAFARLGKRR